MNTEEKPVKRKKTLEKKELMKKYGLGKKENIFKKIIKRLKREDKSTRQFLYRLKPIIDWLNSLDAAQLFTLHLILFFVIMILGLKGVLR